MSTFNRTSMESKLSKDITSDPNSYTFNRTSMESKQLPFPFATFLANLLLIEPVWNRNALLAGQRNGKSSLLIEPVWNRNIVGSNSESPYIVLLIEPVWNRNSYYAVASQKHSPF